MARDEAPIRRIGLLGGTFDPIHYGHLVIAQEATARLALDQVIFMPNGHPPHKDDAIVSSAEDRVAMVDLAIRDNNRFMLSRLEIDRPGPSYTVDTLARLRSSMLGVAMFLVIGGDMVADLPHWHDPQGILAQVAGIAAMFRPGYALAPAAIAALDAQLPGLGQAIIPIEAPQVAISSTLIRSRVTAGLPIRYVTPDLVVAYILQTGLYQTGGAR